MTEPLLEALPGTLPELETRQRDLDAALEASRERIRSLMAQEDPSAGIFHAEAIHTAKQEHMQLRYMKDLCAARLARLREADDC